MELKFYCKHFHTFLYTYEKMHKMGVTSQQGVDGQSRFGMGMTRRWGLGGCGDIGRGDRIGWRKQRGNRVVECN